MKIGSDHEGQRQNLIDIIHYNYRTRLALSARILKHKITSCPTLVVVMDDMMCVGIYFRNLHININRGGQNGDQDFSS
jgi:hypothetical protein